MSDQPDNRDAAIQIDIIEEIIQDQHVDVAVQVNQHNRAVQASVNQLDRAIQILELGDHNYENPLHIVSRRDEPHRQIIVPLNCTCTHPPEHIIANLPRSSYQLSFCCETNPACPHYKMIVTGLSVDQIEVMFNLIFSQAFQCNSNSYSIDSPDR